MKKRTIPLRVCSDNPQRFIPENVDEASEKISRQLNEILSPFFDIISAVKNEPVSVEMRAVCDGLLHAFSSTYNLPEKSTSYVHDDPKVHELYSTSFRRGFEAGLLQNSMIDALMRSGLEYRSYQPIIYEEEN
jgi:hypothetical protein